MRRGWTAQDLSENRQSGLTFRLGRQHHVMCARVRLIDSHGAPAEQSMTQSARGRPKRAQMTEPRLSRSPGERTSDLEPSPSASGARAPVGHTAESEGDANSPPAGNAVDESRGHPSLDGPVRDFS